MSYVNQRYFSVEEETEKRGEPVSIAYLDANNLYGYAMSKPMPVGDFRWLSKEEIKNLNMDSDISEECNTGYIFEVMK